MSDLNLVSRVCLFHFWLRWHYFHTFAMLLSTHNTIKRRHFTYRICHSEELLPDVSCDRHTGTLTFRNTWAYANDRPERRMLPPWPAAQKSRLDHFGHLSNHQSAIHRQQQDHFDVADTSPTAIQPIITSLSPVTCFCFIQRSAVISTTSCRAPTPKTIDS